MSESTGTITVTNGSASVTGSGTLFATNFVGANDILVVDGAMYVVKSVTSNTALTLTQPYAGTTASGKSYDIVHLTGEDIVNLLARKVTELVEKYGLTVNSITDTPGAGKIPQAGSDGKLDDGWLPMLAGATSSQAGAVGLVPAPAAGKQGNYLMGDATWGRDADVLAAVAAGQIGRAVNVVGESLDVDTLTTAGKYYLNGTGTYLNLPSGITLGYLTVHSVTTGGPVQQILTTHTRRVYIRAKTSGTAAWTDWVNIAPPYAQTGEGIGQWVKIDIQDSSAYSLPDGGRWEYFLQLFNKTDGGLYNFTSGVLAGGTSLTIGSDVYRYVGFAKRVE